MKDGRGCREESGGFKGASRGTSDASELRITRMEEEEGGSFLVDFLANELARITGGLYRRTEAG